MSLTLSSVPTWTNNSFWLSDSHPKPVEFSQDDSGITGYAEDGTNFSTKWFFGGQVMKFSFGDAYYWMDKFGNIVYGENDIGLEPMTSYDMQAVSILVSYWQ